MKNIRVRLTIINIKRFVCENKKAILSCALVFLAGVVAGICITIAECQGQFVRVNSNNIVFGAFKVFFLFSIFELIGYFILLFSIINFILTLCSMGVLLILGFMLGKYSCILVACFSISGIINLIFIYIPVFLICFILMTVALIKILEFGSCNNCGKSCGNDCNRNNLSYNYNRGACLNQNCNRNQSFIRNRCNNRNQYFSQSSNCNNNQVFDNHRSNNRCRNIFSNLKPSVIFVFSVYGINVALNFVVFIILGLLFPVIVV